MYRIILVMAVAVSSTIIYDDATTLQSMKREILQTTHEIAENSLLLDSELMPYFNETKIEKEIKEYFDTLSELYVCDFEILYDDKNVSTQFTINYQLQYNNFLRLNDTIVNELNIKEGLYEKMATSY